MSVSVIIPHYGDPLPTRTLALQVLEQLGPNDQLIVADDCSPEPFGSLVGATVIRRKQNGGFGSACNSGAAAATADYLLFLNCDLRICTTFLKDLMEAALPWQPCVAGPRIQEGATLNASARHFPTARHQICEWLTPLARWRGSHFLHEAVGHDMTAIESSTATVTDWLVSAVLLIPRQAFVDVGGFDESFYMNSEEVDLQRRLRSHGVVSVYLPHVSVDHEGGGASDPNKRREWLVASRWVYARKWGGTRRLRAGLTCASCVNLVWNTFRRIFGRETRPLATAREELRLVWRAETVARDSTTQPR